MSLRHALFVPPRRRWIEDFNAQPAAAPHDDVQRALRL